MHSSFLILFLNLGSGEVILIVLGLLVFFGTDKLPEMTRAFGKGIREMKNATAEIQREIEKGTTEIQRDINIADEVSEIKKATDRITSGIKEGINNLQEHHNSKTETASTDEAIEPEKENPLVPPDAIKRD
jgi:sec-independent protein translocase protein TatA